MACKSLSHQAVKGIELTSSIKEDTYTGTCKCSAFLQWSACLCSQTDKIRVWSRTNIYIFFVFLQNIAIPTMAPFSGKKRNHLESHIKKYIGFSFSFGNWLHTVASVTVLIWNKLFTVRILERPKAQLYYKYFFQCGHATKREKRSSNRQAANSSHSKTGMGVKSRLFWSN